MLLKIFTSQNTIKIIEGIQDVEIYGGCFPVNTWQEMYDLDIPPIRGTYEPPTIENFDWKPHRATEPMQPGTDYIQPIMDKESPAKAYPVNLKIVDYQKNGEWKRVAIHQYAYLCNDDGKTISKID